MQQLNENRILVVEPFKSILLLFVAKSYGRRTAEHLGYAGAAGRDLFVTPYADRRLGALCFGMIDDHVQIMCDAWCDGLRDRSNELGLALRF